MMAISKHQFIFILLHIILNLGFLHSDTLTADILVLQSLKQSIDPVSISPSSFLNTWDFQIDPCESAGAHFLGVLCVVTTDNSSSRVVEIDLEGDGLEGFLTPGIGNLTELTVLNLRKNKFRGPMPNSIANLEKLTNLELSDNFFSGSLPPRMMQLKKLVVLDLSRNRLSGSIPPSLSSFRSLALLDLSNNEFSGRIPELTGLWQLRTLDLSYNQLYGSLPRLPQNTKILLLHHNLLSGHISILKRLERLRTLDVSDNRFTGTVDQEIMELPLLIHLNLSQNRFSDIQVMRYSGLATLLQVLDIQGNRLHGRLPVNLVTYENLTTLDLSHNLFTGKIPLEFGERLDSPWRYLNLDHNFLSGTLPPRFKDDGLVVKGSVAHNCLTCPLTLRFCRGGQRPSSECVGQNDDDGNP